MATVLGESTMILTRANGSVVNLSVPLDTATLFLETRDIDLQDSMISKYLDAIVLGITDRDMLENAYLIIKTRDCQNEDYTVEDEINLLNCSDPIFCRPPSRRYARFRLEDRGVRARWTWSTLSLFGEADGAGF